ncbi:MAG: SWIM zinc finger family protein [Blastocatellia bacterium]
MGRWGKKRRGRYDYWSGEYYDYRPTIEAKGGIKSQSQRGAFGESWWAKRWIAVLDSFDIGARLTRGQSYARKGQVLSIDISEGLIKSRVQGSYPTPYNVTIKIKPLAEGDWKKLARTLSTQAIFAAKLLGGEMPQEIEQAFDSAGLSLFPQKLRDLETQCSCPDWSNPCKHIAAVYYLIGEEFDRDPFLLFKLRGKGRDEFIPLLGARAKGERAGEKEKEEPAAALPPEPLAPDPGAFWHGGALPEAFFGEVRLPPIAAALPKRLGSFPFWRGEERFLDAMETIYAATAPHAMEVFVGGGYLDQTEIPAKRGRGRAR